MRAEVHAVFYFIVSCCSPVASHNELAAYRPGQVLEGGGCGRGAQVGAQLQQLLIKRNVPEVLSRCCDVVVVEALRVYGQ